MWIRQKHNLNYPPTDNKGKDSAIVSFNPFYNKDGLPNEEEIREGIILHLQYLEEVVRLTNEEYQEKGVTGKFQEGLVELNNHAGRLVMAIDNWVRARDNKERDKIAKLN